VLGGADILASTIDLFLVQAVIIIALTRILAVAGVYLKQPRVIFEVVGGILLGPSAIGRDTGYMNRIFPTGSLPYIGLIAEFGLILYLFLIGLELDPLSLASHFKRSGAIALVGMIIPFCLGVAISQTLFDNLMATDPKYKDVNFVSFFVFIGTAFAITAFPVLARILRETGLLYARAGALAMGAAALNDAVAWCLLILAISIANAGNMATAGYVFLCVCTFALGLFFVVRPAFTWLVLRFDNSEDPSMRGNLFAFTLIIMFLCAWTTDLLGVHSIFGAFLFGLIVPRNTHLFEMCEDKITDFVMTILLPLYFALSGLKTDVTQLSTAEDGAMVILVCVVATVGKLLGAGIPALMSGLPVRESAVVAVLMNTRGLVELIVLNLGIASGVLNQRVFTVMVIMCIFTTFLTCPVVYYIFPPHLRILEETKKNDDLEPLPQEEHELPEPPPVGAEDGSQVLRRFDSMALCVVVDKLEQLPALMQVLLPLAPSTDTQRLRVLAVRLLEPTYSDRDKFLYATEHGRLTSVESEATVVTRDDTSPRPELLSLSLFCRGNIQIH
jgi:Kef-type K+ transport system membrane component KefB